MAVPRGQTGQHGDSAITAKKDLVMDEGTGLMAERKTVTDGITADDSGPEEIGGAASIHDFTTEGRIRPVSDVHDEAPPT